MKIYNSKTEKIRLEQKENETQKKEIEKKRQEIKMQVLHKSQGPSCQTINKVYIMIVVTVKKCQVFKALTRRTDKEEPEMSK